ncbi:MAG TPA: Calx-beta domain-containing protein, partial [Herpetosiphonaceae bacterium]
VSYTGEQWRDGGNTTGTPQILNFGYKVGASARISDTAGYLEVNALDFSNVVTSTNTTGVALDGNLPANRRAITGTVTLAAPLAAGDEIVLRWEDINDVGNDHGLAVDDFSVTARGGGPVNFPIVTNCPTPVSTPQGTATAAGLTARDADGTVITATITSAAVPGITLNFFQPAAGVGLTATATLNVANTVAAGTYNVVIRWANNDSPTPQTADCTIAVNVIGAPSVRIRDIQGPGHVSPRNGQTVTGVPGIVTARVSNGFYIQDPTPDSDPNTSEGILVFTNSAPAANIVVGASVTVNGTVSEFRTGGATGVGLALTEIINPSTTIVSTGNPLPAPIVIGQGGRVQPTVIIDNDTNGVVETSPTHVFDPAQDGIDFYETLEGMYVQVNNPVVSGPTNSFGEFWVLPDNGANATVRTARGGIVLTPGDFNPERVLIDDGVLTALQVKVNDKFGGPIQGVMDYAFNNFRIQRTNAVTVVDGGLQRESAATPTASQISVAAFNVENLDPGDTTFPAMADMIVNRLKSPDVLALQEIQDNNGETNDSTTDASQTYAALINAIRTAGGPTYQFRDIAPVDDQDGGAPGGNIRVGYLFRTDRGVSFVDRAGGTSTASTTVQTDALGAHPSFSPGRINPTSTAWQASRKPLVGEFSFRGERVIIINNHFNSKGGDQPLFGKTQPPVLSSETQRRQQAQEVNTFVDSILAADADANILVMGDLNDFQFSNPLYILKDRVLSDLVETLPESERYTYVFDGNAQALDHILASGNITTTVPFAYDVIHANAEFPDQISDHEPEIVHLTLNPRVLNMGASSATVGEAAGTATLTVTLSAASAAPVSVSVRTSDGTATAGSDYTAVSTTLTFAPGQTSRTVTVPIINDTAAEGNETFNVTLSNPTGGATVGASASVVTIVDNDSLPVVSMIESLFPVNEAAGTVSVTVVRSGSADSQVTVQYATANGTAIAGQDYTAASGTLTFAPGETTKTITVAILRDAVREGEESFSVTLSNASGATIGTPNATTVLITDGTPALFLPLIFKP